ncbi:MAG: NAD(P)H-dependent glycerol-3-phosphate dehydrogenase [Anaerovoracaceae bacterium]|jgi:glycerol-3-phosphate dehydrogenase (NAD(P)+)
MRTIGIIGAGSWGTALAVTLGHKGHSVRIWDLDAEHLADLAAHRENRRYLPGIALPAQVETADSVAAALDGADIALFSAPAQHFRSAFASAQPYLRESMTVVNVAKGIEQKTLKRMSEIAYEIRPDVKYVVLSGPSHAEEVGQLMPTTVAVGSRDRALAEYMQDVFITDRFRVYTCDDVTGMELGGALKNIIALGTGISDGMGFGDNAKAALMTRGLAEIARLGIALGAEPATFSGLTGVGDLIVTCTSMHSRNRRCGILIGKGAAPGEAVDEVGMVVEGMYTCDAAWELARRVGVEMPITEQIYRVIHGQTDARTALQRLMGRDRRHERD